MRWVLAELRNELAELITELALLKEELRRFEHLYREKLGDLLLKLAEVEAQLEETLASFRPKDADFQRRAQMAREKAEQCRRELTEDQPAPHLMPKSDKLKSLYKQAAKSIHPDLAANEEERALRTRLMAEINAAFAEGDEDELHRILAEWEERPEAIKGQDANADLERTERRIKILQNKLKSSKLEIERLKSSDLFEIKHAAENSQDDLAEFFAQARKKLSQDLAEMQARLSHMKQALND